MRHLIIRHFGPIKEIDINFKRINLFIGPQSSGKSCVLKVASFFDWMERQIQQSQDVMTYCSSSVVTDNLIRFHRLAGYLYPDSYFLYETDTARIEYSVGKEGAEFQWKGYDRWNYRRPKIAYIPAERNLVAAISNWFQVSMNNDNILDFMKEWEFARKSFRSPKSILDLAVQYQYDTASQSDRIIIDGNRTLDFSMTSSGLQSLIPLLVMSSYLTDGYYGERHTTVEHDMLRYALRGRLEIEYPANSAEENHRIIDSLLTSQFTDLFIEEPESHIFPSTQKDFVYELSRMLDSNGRRHSCFLTTHSPYIMTSFNNLIFAGEVAAASEEKERLVSARIAPEQRLRLDEVAAYEMHGGHAYPIIDRATGLISADALDSASQEISEDFDFLLGL